METKRYSGEVTKITTQNPYAKVGDHLNIQVDYDAVSMIASQIIVKLESWGDMYPASGSTGSYFKAPDSWDYSNSCTHWALSGDKFLLESEGMGNGPFTINAQVVPIRIKMKQYTGKITNASEPNMYAAKVGDSLKIQVDYDAINMTALQIIVKLESWGEMYPAGLDSSGHNFLAPDSWDYSNSSTHWALTGNDFLLENERDPFPIKGYVSLISEPPAHVSLVQV